jgi:hypothetical protein
MIPQDKLDKIKEVAHAFPHYRDGAGGQKVISRVIDSKTNFERLDIWREMLGEELWKYIEENTLPKGGKIMNICANWYGTGSSCPLHYDTGNGGEYDESGEVAYTNIWVAEKSDDLEGGYFIQGDLAAIAKFVDPQGLSVISAIKCPLEALDPDVGESISFRSETLHGITKIQKGSRMSFVIQKVGKE